MPKSQKIRLAPLLDKDCKVLFSWINEREDVVFSAPYRPIHEWDHQVWFDSVRNRDDVVVFGIRTVSDNKLVGMCQLVDVHSIHKSAELRVRIGEPEYRDRGIGSEAVRLLVSFGFGDMNLHRIFLHVFDDNQRAISVYQKLGFVEEGRLREAAFVDGRYKSIVIMSLLKEEYDRRDPPT